MPCSKPFKYPSYECYKKLKKQFVERIKEDNYYISEYIEEFEPKYEEVKLKKLEQLPEIFTNLKKYLSNGEIFGSSRYNGEGTCNYISYLLYDGIRNEKNGKCDKDTFNNFKEFVDSYSISRKSDMCKNNLIHLNDHEFKKMNALYQLYEWYNKLTLTYLDENNRCDAFGNIIAIYNKALENYDNQDGNDYNLIEKLLDLKNLTVESKIPHYSKCKYREREFNKPELYLKRLEEIETKKRQQEELRRQEEQQQLQRKKEEEALEKQRSQQREELVIKDLLGNRENLLSVSPREQRETGQSFDVESPGGGVYRVRHGFERPLSFFPGQQEQMEGRHPEFKDQNMETSTTSGTTGSITDTISGFIRDVEPGPVLGVSGGMGALFLLFKYTPFGYFFGGRRRRMHQIPRTFGGFPPGEFPNFHEYDGGFIGYAPMNINPLAE